MYRVIVIGAGITGLSIARWLTRYRGLEVIVIDKEPDVGWGVTKANTSIIHPCHEENPDKHPLRSKLCLEGHNLWYKWVKELEILAKWPGEIIVATNDEELKGLHKYIDYAYRIGVPGVRLIDREEMLRLDPWVNPDAIGGLYAPTAGTVNPMMAAIAIAENIVDNGGKLLLSTRVEDIVVRDGKVVAIETSKGRIEADIVVNAAGLYADKISRMAGIDDYCIHPRRGQYLLFSDRVDVKPKKILHTAPTPKTKGVYAITTVDGNLLIGPTAEDLPEEAREENMTTRQGLDLIYEMASKILRKLPPRNRVIKTFAGLRPEPSTGTFIIRFHEKPWGFVEAAGIRSPGLTAAPAIGKHVSKLITERLENIEPRKDWKSKRKAVPRPAYMTPCERDKLIRENPDYGWIICVCRKVSLGEIIEAVKRMKKIGVSEITLDGIKFRTHSMYGDCQGSQCRSHIAYLLWKRLGIQPWRITIKGDGSKYAFSEVKALLRGGHDA